MLNRLFLCLLLAAPVPAQADELTPQKKDDIRKLIVTTGGTRIGVQFAGVITQNLAKSIKTARPDVPERVFAAVNNEQIGRASCRERV